MSKFIDQSITDNMLRAEWIVSQLVICTFHYLKYGQTSSSLSFVEATALVTYNAKKHTQYKMTNKMESRNEMQKRAV